MSFLNAKLATTLMLAVAFACIAAWVIAHRYRKAMQRLMRAPVAGAAPPVPGEIGGSCQLAAPIVVSFADNRRANLRLSLLLIGLSCLLAVATATIWYALVFRDEPLKPTRVAAMAVLYVWPVIPVLGLMWRWTGRRIFGVLLLWCVFCYFFLLWRSIEPRPYEMFHYIVIEVAPALLLVAFLFLGSATRAVAPWLIPLFAGLVWSSILGMDALNAMVQRQSPWLTSLPSWVHPYMVVALFTLLPWLIAWWPSKRLARALGRAYARKWFSELMVAFSTVWTLVLLDKVVVRAEDSGFLALALFLPLLCIPLVMWLYSALQTRSGRPPTLLVLRVFQHDVQVQDLFDHVIERWRLSGNTVMIAGTDLADRTLDADDIFTFLDRKLSSRFIQTPADVAPRIAAFDLAPDLDGRYRVNECYCHDTTWQQALHALVARSDVVLMDLRGFKAHNAGCRFELSTLSSAPRPLHVVVLTDGATDREAAAQSVACGHAERFVWIDASRVDAGKRREVLKRLFDYHTTDQSTSQAALHTTG